MKEIWDRIEADYIEESQFQIPNPELGPLERRVGLTYEDALFSEDISIKDTEYWFTEPEGALDARCGLDERNAQADMLRGLLPLAATSNYLVSASTGGWNQEPKRIPKAEVVA